MSHFKESFEFQKEDGIIKQAVGRNPIISYWMIDFKKVKFKVKAQVVYRLDRIIKSAGADRFILLFIYLTDNKAIP